SWKSVAEISRIFSAATGVTDAFLAQPTLYTSTGQAIRRETVAEFVRTQVVEPWPTTVVEADRVPFKFSDWRDPPAEDARHNYDFDSIMTDPMWRQYVTYDGVAADIA